MRRLITISAVLSSALWVSGCSSNYTALSSTSPVDQTSPAWNLPQASPPRSITMPEGKANVAVPPGFISFCIRFQEQCAMPTVTSNKIAMTPEIWATMIQVNSDTNVAIAPKEDVDHYGRAEYWTIPTDGYGDCDDYVVTKRKALIQAGLPKLALRIAVVLIPSDGSRHAVLTVSTDTGDYVLDNLTAEIRSWSDTDYIWIERQAGNNPWTWVAFQNTSDSVGTAAVGSAAR